MEEKIVKKVVKICIGILSVVLLMIIGFIVGSYVQMEKYKEINSENINVDTIAIVNMDSGVEVDGDIVNYASQLMDTSSNIYTVKGLTDAKQGVENGTYAAYIVIPDKFSEDIRTFYDNPKKMNLEYYYNENLDVDSHVKAVENVNLFINELNSNVAYMYVGTILDEYHRVQDYAANLITNDNKELDNLENVNVEKLVQAIDVAENISVENNVESVDLSSYTGKNSDLLKSLQDGYNGAVKEANDEYDNVREQGEVCKEKTDGLLNQFVSAMDATKENGMQIVADGEQNLMQYIGNYNDKIAVNSPKIKEQYNSMINEQISGNNDTANDKIDLLYSRYYEAATELVSGQKNWNDSYNALNEGWKEYYDSRLIQISNNLIDYNNDVIWNMVDFIGRRAYEKGYEAAIASAKSKCLQAAKSDATPSDAEPDTPDIPDIPDIPDWVIADCIELYNEVHNDNPLVADVSRIDSTDTDKMEDETLNFLTAVIRFPDVKDGYIHPKDKPQGGIEIIIEPDDKSLYVVNLERTESNKIESVDRTIDEIVEDFKLEDEYKQISDVLSMEVFQKIDREVQNQLRELDKPLYEFGLEMSKFNNLRESHDPYRYISEANLASYLSDISGNTSDMEEAVYKNNTDYLQYTMDVCDAAYQNSENYRKAVNDAYEKTKSNVTYCIGNLRESRENTNENNIRMINGFADTLAYTRVGSQGNAKVYDFIINPVESNEINRVVTTKEEASELYLKYMAIAAIVISALLCVLVIMGMLMKSKTLDEEYYDE